MGSWAASSPRPAHCGCPRCPRQRLRLDIATHAQLWRDRRDAQHMARRTAGQSDAAGRSSRRAADLPLIVDCDTGFGEALNVMQAVRTLEEIGAACVQIEDQQFPKKCGHLNDKKLVPVEDMCRKVAAAKKAARELADLRAHRRRRRLARRRHRAGAALSRGRRRRDLRRGADLARRHRRVRAEVSGAAPRQHDRVRPHAAAFAQGMGRGRLRAGDLSGVVVAHRRRRGAAASTRACAGTATRRRCCRR